jgi:hypothetical protein
LVGGFLGVSLDIPEYHVAFPLLLHYLLQVEHFGLFFPGAYRVFNGGFVSIRVRGGGIGGLLSFLLLLFAPIVAKSASHWVLVGG